MKKKVAILISGQVRLHKENLNFLKKIFFNFDYEIFATLWENQKEISKICSIYKIKKVKKIKQKDWSRKIKKIKYVFGEENRSYKIVNIFHMWHSISESVKFLIQDSKMNSVNYDYVCRFRTDIFSKKIPHNFNNQIQRLKDDEIIFPENLHSRGLNDLFFLCNFKTISKFKYMMKYLDQFIKENKPISSEYLLYHFTKKNSLKIKLFKQFVIDLFGIKNKSHLNYNLRPTKNAHIPLIDKMNLKYIKYKIKFLRKINYLFMK